MNLLKALWCWLSRGHSYAFVRNIYGDEIYSTGGNRSAWKCGNCGWYQLRRGLIHLTPLEEAVRKRVRTHFTDGPKCPGKYGWRGRK